MFKYIFGPVQSRRFGLSLGIDLSPDTKSCNFDCLYCELKSSTVTTKIKNPPLVEEIIKEVKIALKKYPDIDVITITSNGEPTLYPHLNSLICKLEEVKKQKKVLILSNSSNIYDKSVQKSLSRLDIVKLSLDCATQKCFKKIDRPVEGIDIKKIIGGLKEFRKVFKNELVIEILIVKGINDTKSEMTALEKALVDIKPDRIDLGTIDRPPAFDVKGVGFQKLKELREYLGSFNVSIVYKKEAEKKVDFSKLQILSTIRRRPQSNMDIEYLFSDKSKKNLQELLLEKKIIKKDVAGVLFYTLTQSEDKEILSK